MILVVNGADFSANKIDTIDIPIELSEWTKAVIAKYPSFTFTDAIKRKLELFYRELSTNGILDKIQYLSFPVFGNSISEAVANVLSDSYTPNVPSGANSVYTQTMGYGIKRSAAVASESSLISLPSESGSIMSLKDLHIMAYPVDEVETGSSYAATSDVFDDLNGWSFAAYYNTFGLGHATYGWAQCLIWASLNYLIGPIAYAGATGASHEISLDSNMRMGAYPMLISNNGSVFSASVNSQEFVNATPTNGYATGSTAQSTSPVYFGLQPIVVDGHWSARRFGVFSLGKYLTNAESVTYQNALKALIGSVIA